MILASFFSMILFALVPPLENLPDQATIALMWVLFLPAGIAFASWSLVLPAVALEHDHGGLGGAFNLANGNRWPLTVIVYLLPGAFIVGLPWLPIWTFIGADLVLELVNMVVTVFTLAMLSLSYAQLRQYARQESAE